MQVKDIRVNKTMIDFIPSKQQKSVIYYLRSGTVQPTQETTFMNLHVSVTVAFVQ